jgi:hypothetical protein
MAGIIPRRGGERSQLGLDVRGRLAARRAPGVAGLQQLADLGLAVARPLLRGGDPAAADLAVSAAARGQRPHGHHGRDRDDGEEDDRERLLHAESVTDEHSFLSRSVVVGTL